jgi:hypothetical protein
VFDDHGAAPPGAYTGRARRAPAVRPRTIPEGMETIVWPGTNNGGTEMGGKIQSGNFAHDRTCDVAESTRQAAVSGAAQSPAGQAAVNAAEITWARAVIASCKANNGGQGAEAFQSLLRALGTGGV